MDLMINMQNYTPKGTGVRFDGSSCIHGISCPCPKCSPSCCSNIPIDKAVTSLSDHAMQCGRAE